MRDLDWSDYEADGQRMRDEQAERHMDEIAQELFGKPYDQLNDNQAELVMDQRDARYPED